MWVILTIILIVVIYILYEYRLRNPDQIVLYDRKGLVLQRKARFYPRHFSLVIPKTIHPLTTKVEAEARGKIVLNINLALTYAASLDHLPELIRIGGWSKDSVTKASKELDIMLHALVKEFSEKFEIEGLTSEKLTKHLKDNLSDLAETLGLNIISLTVQSIDPEDEEITKAMQQQETARIMEQTEIANQKAKINTRKVQLEAEEKIALSEHDLVIKKYKLKKEQEEKNAEIANQRVKEELERRKMQLELDQKEVELIKNNPELIVLTPQVARLAEASQSLRNARTVVNLSGNDAAKGTQMVDLLHTFLQNMVQAPSKDSEGKTKKKG
jgi:hypothetical protein